eukprot:6195097-Pleurochrysis_carterae.AAC.4
MAWHFLIWNPSSCFVSMYVTVQRLSRRCRVPSRFVEQISVVAPSEQDQDHAFSSGAGRSPSRQRCGWLFHRLN